MINPINYSINPAHADMPNRLEKSGARPEQASVRGRARVADDEAELGRSSPQQVLNQKVLAAINQQLQGAGQKNIAELDPADFTPEKVANRILGFIGRAIGLAKADGADEDKVNEMFGQARKGVERGFKEAREILEDLGVLKDKVKEDVDDTYGRVQDGLDRMERGDPWAPVSEAGFQGMAYNEDNSLSLEVTTRDGDTVTLNLQRQMSASSMEYAQRSADGSLYVREDRMSMGLSLQYTVEGELDDGERQALKDLVAGIDGLADDFFAGGSANLLKRAMDLGYDSEELSGFSLSLRQTQSFQAAAAYQSVGSMRELPEQADERVENPFAQLGGGGQQLFGLFDQMRNLMNGFMEQSLFAEPRDLLSGLLGQRLGVDERFPSVFGRPEQPDSMTPQRVADQLLGAAQSLDKLESGVLEPSV